MVRYGMLPRGPQKEENTKQIIVTNHLQESTTTSRLVDVGPMPRHRASPQRALQQELAALAASNTLRWHGCRITIRCMITVRILAETINIHLSVKEGDSVFLCQMCDICDIQKGTVDWSGLRWAYLQNIDASQLIVQASKFVIIDVSFVCFTYTIEAC